MTRVIHTGDTHIGYQQYHSPERRRDFLAAFERVVEDAVEDGVDAVVHAGDLFHNRRPELRDLLGTLSVLRRLDEADIPFLAVVGNHEVTRGGQWLDLFERLGLARRLGAEPVAIGETAFYGLDYVPRSRRADLDYAFEPHEATHAALVTHGLFEPFAHADWDTEAVLREATVEFDAMLLGDNHIPDAAEVAGTWVTYCGSTERVSATERDARGYNLVEFGAASQSVEGERAAEKTVGIRRRSLETRPFAFVDLELAEGEGIERVREQVRQHDLEDAVVVVVLTGEGEPVTPAAVEEFAVEEGALVARVTDRRELESESEQTISFADPDEAVRERVGELGLSSAALEIDDAVRAEEIADSNVRESVKSRVSSLVDDDLSSFEQAEATSDAEPDGTGEVGEAVGDDATADGTLDPGETNEETAAATDENGGEPTGDEGDNPADDGVDDQAVEKDEPAAASGADDGQVSMEDYL